MYLPREYRHNINSLAKTNIKSGIVMNVFIIAVIKHCYNNSVFMHTPIWFIGIARENSRIKDPWNLLGQNFKIYHFFKSPFILIIQQTVVNLILCIFFGPKDKVCDTAQNYRYMDILLIFVKFIHSLLIQNVCLTVLPFGRAQLIAT